MSQPRLLQTLWGDTNPYEGFSHRRFRSDLQGWNSHHIFLADTLKAIQPSVVVDLGVWKGGSTIHMAEVAKNLNLQTTILAVDTWLGSWEHWEQPEWFPDLLHQNGYPSLYYTFLTNVIERGVTDHVVPLPLDSANAAVLLGRRGIRPGMIHIDGGHDFEAVAGDLRRWWPLLASGGVLVADDYDRDGKVWASVRDAVDAFIAITPHVNFEAIPYKCRFVKP